MEELGKAGALKVAERPAPAPASRAEEGSLGRWRNDRIWKSPLSIGKPTKDGSFFNI